MELFLTVVFLMSTFKNKYSLRTIEAQIVQKPTENNEARPKFTGSYKKKRVQCNCTVEIWAQKIRMASWTTAFWP